MELACPGWSLKEGLQLLASVSSLCCHHLCVGLGLEARSPCGWACDMGPGAVMTWAESQGGQRAEPCESTLPESWGPEV